LTFNNALPNDSAFKSSGLKLVLLVNLGGFPLLLPPPSLAAWKFLGYYSIFFVSSGIDFLDLLIVLKPRWTKQLLL
jgi:hypothetical protein